MMAADTMNGTRAKPSVDVLMLARNVEDLITAAAESVLLQNTIYPVRLIIAEDGSTDGTKDVCARLALAHGDRLLYLPGERNIGIAARTVEGLARCTAPYVAICDSDDRWTDPEKLAAQIAFMEEHPDHGLSFSDVSIEKRSGEPVPTDAYDAVRADYASGHVFARLLQGNFINNSTTVVRRELLEALQPNACRDDLIGDHLRWLQVAMRTQVHFLPARTTAYRLGGVSGTDASARNRGVMMALLGGLLLEHHRCGTPVTWADKRILARKTAGVLARSGTPLGVKLALVLPLFRYLPAVIGAPGTRGSGK